ncbi:MAG: hypothetical protein Q9227_007336 [Pyrenula ochraceoflavens]
METLSLYLLTFNCARTYIQPALFSEHLFSALPASSSIPDIFVLSLQELAPIGPAFLGGSFVTPYLNKFRQAVKLATVSKNKENGASEEEESEGSTYVNVVSRNVGLTGIMIFMKKSLVERIRGLEIAGVGVGLWDMSNKGAVGVRIRIATNESTGSRAHDEDELDEDRDEENDTITLTFLSAHLAPFEEALLLRNANWKAIVQNLIFDSPTTSLDKPSTTDEGAEDVPLLRGIPPSSSTPPDSPPSQIYTPNSHLFLSGDLNYRTSSTRPLPSSLSSFPKPTPSPSSPNHFTHLLPHDQLTTERHQNRTCHHLTEPPITFPPTYKYKPKHPSSTSPAVLTESSLLLNSSYPWSTHRWPSWCDRILYLPLPTTPSSPPASPSSIKIHTYTSLPLFLTSDHRPVALSLSIPNSPLLLPPDSTPNTHSAPFPITQDWRARRRAARRKEIVVGVLAYLGLTWEGNGVLVAVFVGGLGGWWVLRSLLLS